MNMNRTRAVKEAHVMDVDSEVSEAARGWSWRPSRQYPATCVRP